MGKEVVSSPQSHFCSPLPAWPGDRKGIPSSRRLHSGGCRRRLPRWSSNCSAKGIRCRRSRAGPTTTAFSPATGNWHFVDMPLAATRYDPQRDCKDRPEKGRLHRGRARPPAQRAALRRNDEGDKIEALKFAVHFFGDITSRCTPSVMTPAATASSSTSSCAGIKAAPASASRSTCRATSTRRGTKISST